jgi:hypothetical protein
MTTNPETTKAARATSAQEWKAVRREGELIELPSGRMARLRPVALMELFKLGRIPNSLMKIVAQLTHSESVEPMVGSIEKSIQSIEEFSKLLDLLTCSCFVEPRVTEDDPGDDEIHVDDVTFEEKSFVLEYSQTPARAVRNFRLQQTLIAGVVSDSEKLQAAPKPDNGDSRPLGSLPIRRGGEPLRDMDLEQTA